MSKGSRFSKKYSWFLSEATNEEIVSISKELSESMSAQLKALGTASLSLLAISVFGLLGTVLLVNIVTEDVTDYDTPVDFVRMAAIALMCVSIVLSFSAMNCLVKASSSSALAWRNIRETADDEKVYEQMTAINKINILLFRCRNNISLSSMTIMLGMVMVALSYVFKMLAATGYV